LLCIAWGQQIDKNIYICFLWDIQTQPKSMHRGDPIIDMNIKMNLDRYWAKSWVSIS